MGWNSWNFFAGKVTDKDIRAAADQLVSTGMKDAGYIYVNIDDTWEGERDANGVLHANAKFPDMKALADYVHSKGLKIGIYSSPGPKTCGGYEGSLGHEEQDAQLYASWGIDYLKYDLCSFIGDVMEKQAPNDKAAQMRLMIAAYDKMDKALKATGRPIVYSLCQYGWDAVWEWGPRSGATSGAPPATSAQLGPHLRHRQPAGGPGEIRRPGHWNDPDMLEVGNGKLTLAENRTHFSMWAMLAAPLLAGNDLPNMKPEIKAILTNRDVIAIDQDRWASRPRAPTPTASRRLDRHLSGGALAIAVTAQRGSDRYSTHPFHLNLAKLGLARPAGVKIRQRPLDRQGHHAHRQQTMPVHRNLAFEPRHCSCWYAAQQTLCLPAQSCRCSSRCRARGAARCRRRPRCSLSIAVRVIHHARRTVTPGISRSIRSFARPHRARSLKRPPARRPRFPAARLPPSAAAASCPPTPRPALQSAAIFRRRAPAAGPDRAMHAQSSPCVAAKIARSVRVR
jgi:alpha-galactosidase